jgi:hypothetical protein
VRIRNRQLNVALHHVLMLCPGNRSLPGQCPEALDQIGSA